MAKKKKKKLSKFGRILSDILIVVCLVIAGFSGYNLYKELKEYNESKEAYDTLTPEVITVNEETNEKVIDHESLLNMNSDYKGWIYLEDSTIDYPFVQTTDNEYYLKHLFNGEWNNSGCVFIDAKNNPDFTDRNTVLYAHNMKNGTMFADIEQYKNADYYSQHKVIHIYTPSQNYEVYPIAGMLSDGQDDYVQITFNDDAEFLNYTARFIENSTFTSDETLEATDSIVMLSTCNYDVNDGRYVLIGKLVPVSNE